MRDRSIRNYALGARLLLVALAMAGLSLLFASLVGLSPVLVNAIAIGGIKSSAHAGVGDALSSVTNSGDVAIIANAEAALSGGQANPAPPIGPALGSKGINIMEFCKQFNARTQDKQGKVLPVLITVYSDKSFDFVIKTPPAAIQLMEAAKIQKGSKESNRSKVGKVSWDQIKVIAEDKMPDLNCFTVESAMKMVAGTARSMGLNVDGKAPWEN